MIPFRGQRSGVKVTRSINAEMENVPYLGKGKAYKLQTWYTDGVRDSHHQYAR